MQLHLHQTHHTIGDFNGVFKYLEDMKPIKPGLHLFPELFLSGYPLLDLCLQKGFIEQVLELHQKLETWAIKTLKGSDSLLLVGGLDYKFDDQGLPADIYNVIWALDGSGMKRLYAKKLLPNYDIFDEEKYFTPGEEPGLLEWNGKRIGLLVCEDMWHSSHHIQDPVKELWQSHPELDLVVNLSASPYHISKSSKRLARAREISHLFKAPFAYVNRVGGEDEVLFDGDSFVADGDGIAWRGKLWQSDLGSLDIDAVSAKSYLPLDAPSEVANTWESLFTPALDRSKNPIQINSHNEATLDEMRDALLFGLREYASKCGFNNFLVAVSGGIDSALVLTLARLALKPGQKLEAIYMPGFFSSSLSYDYSAQLCENLDVPMRHLPIKFTHSSLRNQFQDVFGMPLEGLSDENVQSRLRGMLLYTRSNQTNAMVINTSNKSELAVGYSTQYGDSVGALSLLGDLYKTEVFALCEHLNRRHNHPIPTGIIERAPSAELREDQTDQQSLPPYDRLDAILEGLLSYRMSVKELQESGFDADEVTKVNDLWRKSEYKRHQFCPIIKIKSKSFGFGYRVPICKL
ncbi:MAG: NAD(+) synthase [Halobacteriovorax sp.]|nr:NAD(+) synthase [Halobacteriovorax sp.]